MKATLTKKLRKVNGETLGFTFKMSEVKLLGLKEGNNYDLSDMVESKEKKQ